MVFMSFLYNFKDLIFTHLLGNYSVFFFPFNSVGFCFIAFNALLFGVYTLKTAK